RSGDHFEVLRAIGVGADIEQAITLIDVIFPVGETRGDQARLAAQFGVDQPAFRRLVIMRVDDDEPVAERAADADEKAWILLLEDDRIVGLLGADRMQPYAVGPVIIVIFGVVDGAGIIGPDIGAGSILDGLSAILAGLDIADDDVVIFRASAVGGPGEIAVRAVMLGAGKAE